MTTFSADGQDLFVLGALAGRRDGYFLDIGAAMPIENNNTFLFERDYGWTGLMFEFDPRYWNALYTTRSATLITQDATDIDYRALFEKHNVPKVIDYLSLDIDPPDNTMKVLRALPLDEYIFSCVTFEHDSYWFGDSVRRESRELFEKHGYTLKVADAPCPLGPYEDWYIHEDKL